MASQDQLSLKSIRIPHSWPFDYPPNTSNSIQVFFYITFDPLPKIADDDHADSDKLPLLSFCSNLGSWSSDPAAVRKELSEIFDSLGIDWREHGRFIKQIEDSVVSELRNLNSEMLAFLIKITNSNTYYCLKPAKRKEECSICLQDIGERGKMTPCGHVFHGKCITKWLHQTASCPLCRSVLF